MQESQLMVAVEGSSAFMRIAGQGSLKMAEGFKKWNQDLATRADIDCVMLDMSECTTLDSTFMGLMIELARNAIKRTRATGKAVSLLVVNAKPEHHAVLDEIGVTRVWQYADFAMDDHAWKVQVTARRGAVELNDTARDIIIKAHQQLMELDSANIDRFKNVVELLQKNP